MSKDANECQGKTSEEVRGSLSVPNKSDRGLETQIQVALGDAFHDESGHMR